MRVRFTIRLNYVSMFYLILGIFFGAYLLFASIEILSAFTKTCISVPSEYLKLVHYFCLWYITAYHNFQLHRNLNPEPFS